MAALFSGGGPAPAGAAAPVFIPAAGTLNFAKIYGVLSGADLSDENLFYLAARLGGGESAEVRELREAYRRAIVNGAELEVRQPISSGLRARVSLDPAIHDKFDHDFGARMQALEVGLARNFNAGPAAVAQAVEIAFEPRSLAAQAIAGRLNANTIYSERFVTEWTADLFALSPPLALRAARSSKVTAAEARRWWLEELGLLEFPGWTRDYFRFVFTKSNAIYDRELHAADRRGTTAAMGDYYVHALRKLDRAREGLAALPQSPLKSVSAGAAAELRAQLEFELQTLPQRISAWKMSVASPGWESADWFNFRPEPWVVGSVITAAEWVRTVNLAILGAGLLLPVLSAPAAPVAKAADAAAACEPLLLSAPEVPLDFAAELERARERDEVLLER